MQPDRAAWQFQHFVHRIIIGKLFTRGQGHDVDCIIASPKNEPSVKGAPHENSGLSGFFRNIKTRLSLVVVELSVQDHWTYPNLAIEFLNIDFLPLKLPLRGFNNRILFIFQCQILRAFLSAGNILPYQRR